VRLTPNIQGVFGDRRLNIQLSVWALE